MAINIKRYVDITSGVGGQAAAGARELIGRVLTTSQMAPFGSVMEFSSLDNVGGHFGTSSPEYAFASWYFGFVSKLVTTAKKLSFARYVTADSAPQLIGTPDSPALGDFKSITDGSMSLSMGGATQELTGMDFSSASSLAAVAAAVQDKINAYSAGGALWTTAKVTFANGQFILTGGETGVNPIAATTAAASGTYVGVLLGWDISSNPVVSPGADAETPAEAASRTAEISDNFGSFTFIDQLQTADFAAVAAWNKAQNVKYMFSMSVTPSGYSEAATAAEGMDGTVLTLDPSGQYAQFMPMAILATTDYRRINATQNYMFQQFGGVTPSVSTDKDADKYDAVRVNYYGATQTAGSQLAFYQRGQMMGSITDIGVFCNEMWLKDALLVEFMNLLIALPKLPANRNGIAMARNVMQIVFELALDNGTFMPGKELTSTQKAYIESMTGDPEAWRDVANNGYWVNVYIEQKTSNGVTEFILKYLLIYSKGDSIRKVEGSDILI